MIEVMTDEAVEALRITILDALGASFTSKRKDAVSARASSGIEDEWQGDEEFNQGYDAANRHEFVNTASKPSETGTSSAPTRATGSTVFPNITQPHVDAISARVGDMLLPTDDRNYKMEPTPIPDMLEDEQNSMPMPVPMQPPMQAQQGQPQQGMPQATAPLSPIAQATADTARIKAEATRKAENAEKQIDDWLAECQYHSEVRKVIDDAAKLGSGVLKGPVPIKRKSNQWQKSDDGTTTLVIIESIVPSSRRIDPWNLFPDPACGDSIHNGSYIFERDYLTSKKLEDLKGLPGYIDSQIDLCLEEGAKGQEEPDSHAQSQTIKDQFEVWYVHATIKAEELLAAGCDCDETVRTYPAILTMVNDRVIRASLNPLDSGEFPYDVIPWKRRPGMPWGSGLARQMRTPQRIVVAATRKLMDNAGQASGPQFVVRRGVKPENDRWEITPHKIWVEDDDASSQGSAPFSSVVIPMLQVELMNIIQMGMKMAEDVTGMPMLMQGSQGSAPDTVGGMSILNNNANAVLRRIARLFDSCITEPHIRRYYNWLMEYGEDPETKGDFQIIARGSTALVERDIQSREMIGVLQLCLNPAYGKNPERAMDEFLKSRRFTPDAFDYTPEELQARKSQQPQPAPAVQVAQIRAQVDMAKTDKTIQKDMQIAQIENQTAQHRITVDTDRDTVMVNAEAQKNQQDAILRSRELEMKLQLAQLDYASKHQIKLEEVKAKLADTSMKLNVTKDLAIASHMMDNHRDKTAQPVITPPIEPSGRAPNGQSYQA
jgi:hypothetical protein